MDEQIRKRRAEAADTLERLLDEYHDDYDEWDRDAIQRAIDHLRGTAADTSRPAEDRP